LEQIVKLGNRNWIYIAVFLSIICGIIMILLEEIVIGVVLISLGLIYLVIPMSKEKETTSSKPGWLQVILAVVCIAITLLLLLSMILS